MCDDIKDLLVQIDENDDPRKRLQERYPPKPVVLDASEFVPKKGILTRKPKALYGLITVSDKPGGVQPPYAGEYTRKPAQQIKCGHCGGDFAIKSYTCDGSAEVEIDDIDHDSDSVTIWISMLCPICHAYAAASTTFKVGDMIWEPPGEE